MTTLAIAFVVVLLTSVVHGAVGFGMNLLAAPVLLVLDPALVPGPAVALGLLVSVLVAVRERAAVDRSLGWAVAGLFPGTALALVLLTVLPATPLAVGTGLVVLLAVALSATDLRVAPTPRTLATAGAASGLLATAASIGGPPLALVYADDDGPSVRSHLSGFFVVTAVVSLVALAVSGHLGTSELEATAALTPAVLVGFAVSGPVRPWFDAGRTRPAILALSAVAGLAAVVRALLG